MLALYLSQSINGKFRPQQASIATAGAGFRCNAPSSWEKRTGFRFKFFGETYASDSGQIDALPSPELPHARLKPSNSNLDLKAGRPQPAPNGEAATAASVAKDRTKEEKEKERKKRDQELAPPVRKWKDSDGEKIGCEWADDGGGREAGGRLGKRRRGEGSSRCWMMIDLYRGSRC